MANLLKRIADWQHWPFYPFYTPISAAWLWYYAKTRSIWFFTSSNPTLAFGGFEGERKSVMYKQLPPCFCPKSIYISPSMPFDDVLQKLATEKMDYPFIVKPDVGMKGILFRKIQSEDQLRTYHSLIPADYIIQQFLDLPLEVSVFYYRRPGSSKGRITALIQKDLLEVKGDGTSSVMALINRRRDLKHLLPSLKKQYGETLHRVLAIGEKFHLSHIANLVNGATFKNLQDKIDADLLQVFDNISHNNQFYYGRYDIKCYSIDDLKKGENFFILEFNGAGSVPNHIYTGTYTLLQAYKEILVHWQLMYEASKVNHQLGYRYWSFMKGHRFLKGSKKHFDVLKKLDKELLL